MLPLAGMPAGPIPVLVVSSWYPSALDPVAGRFVADQVGTLAARGNVSPAVVSFDPADLIGSGAVRARIAGAVATHVSAALRGPDETFTDVTSGSRRVPVARLAVPSGRYRQAGATHALVARAPALEALAERWTSGRETGVPVPAVIHAHTVYPDGAAAARLAASLDRPLILTEHASTVARLVAAPGVRAAYVAAVAAASHLIVVSRSLADELVREMPEIAPKVTVIPNGVAMDEFHPAPIEDRRPGELLFVGYRKATKGIATLLRATALVRATHPGVSLRLVGGSPTADLEVGWRRQAEELGIADIVAFEGPADRAGVAAAMARASLFVHPSPRETFGVVAVEALAAGTPVIATDSGGVTEILGPRPDELGAVVAPDRPELLAAAIGAALDRRAAFDPAALRAAVESRFSASSVAERLEALYAEATTDRERASRPAASPTLAAGGSAPRRVVVALDPARASEVERLARLGATATLTLVTSAEARVDETVFAAVVPTAPGVRISGLADAAVLRSGAGGLGRWLQLIRHPVALARRRGWLGGLEDAAATAGDAAIRAAIARLTEETGSSLPEIVCADGIDHLAASAVLSDGLGRPGPGGIRWLGDALGAGATPDPSPG